MFELLVFRKFFQKSVLCFRHCLPKQSPKASVPLLLSTVVISRKGWCLWRRPCGPAGCVCALFIVVAKRCASRCFHSLIPLSRNSSNSVYCLPSNLGSQFLVCLLCPSLGVFSTQMAQPWCILFSFSTHMQDLQEVTQDLHYENFRSERLKRGGRLLPQVMLSPRSIFGHLESCCPPLLCVSSSALTTKHHHLVSYSEAIGRYLLLI